MQNSKKFSAVGFIILICLTITLGIGTIGARFLHAAADPADLSYKCSASSKQRTSKLIDRYTIGVYDSVSERVANQICSIVMSLDSQRDCFIKPLKNEAEILNEIRYNAINYGILPLNFMHSANREMLDGIYCYTSLDVLYKLKLLPLTRAEDSYIANLSDMVDSRSIEPQDHASLYRMISDYRFINDIKPTESSLIDVSSSQQYSIEALCMSNVDIVPVLSLYQDKSLQTILKACALKLLNIDKEAALQAIEANNMNYYSIVDAKALFGRVSNSSAHVLAVDVGLITSGQEELHSTDFMKRAIKIHKQKFKFQ